MIHGEMASFVLLGATLGLSAGISPGPLLTLVISESLQHGRKEGIKVALSPLITDLPIILISLLVLAGLGKSSAAIGLIAFAGAVFLIFLGWECLRTKGLAAVAEKVQPKSIKKGVVANLLNPHPYLFWITVGAPTIVKARQNGIVTLVLFFIVFYLFLTGSKILIAHLAGRSRSYLTGKAYVRIMKVLGIILFLFAAFFIYDGIRMLAGNG